MRDLLCFDFDGTLVDSAPDIASAVNIFLAELGHPKQSFERIKASIGNGLKDLLLSVDPEERKAPPEVFERHLNRLHEIYQNHYLDSIELFPGVIEFLRHYTGPMAIVSNKPLHFIEGINQHLGLDQIPWLAIIGGDSLSKKKPDPLPFRHVMGLADRPPHQSWMVGDGHPDIEGAVATGMNSVAVSYGYTDFRELRRIGAQHLIHTLSDLLELLPRT